MRVGSFRVRLALTVCLLLVASFSATLPVSAQRDTADFERLGISERYDCGEVVEELSGGDRQIGGERQQADDEQRFMRSDIRDTLDGAPAPEGVYWIVTSLWKYKGDQPVGGIPTELGLQLIAEDGSSHPQIAELTQQLTGEENGFVKIPPVEESGLAGNPGKEYQVLYVFDVPKAANEPILSVPEHRGEREFGVQLPCDEDVPDPTEGSSEPKEDGVITAFGERELIHVGFDKWWVTFEPGVEVRYFIGDQSIVPRRGQFLVIWFIQETANYESLPLGSFELRASTGPGEPFTTYGLSREGTAALIVTEYDWNPSLMDRGIPYRTGIVFDIRPEDTHFELRFPVPINDPWPKVPVQIAFDA